jgi:hypothetical protein
MMRHNIRHDMLRLCGCDEVSKTQYGIYRLEQYYAAVLCPIVARGMWNRTLCVNSATMASSTLSELER